MLRPRNSALIFWAKDDHFLAMANGAWTKLCRLTVLHALTLRLG